MVVVDAAGLRTVDGRAEPPGGDPGTASPTASPPAHAPAESVPASAAPVVAADEAVPASAAPVVPAEEVVPDTSAAADAPRSALDDALRAAETAPDPVQRFPFRASDVRGPGGRELDVATLLPGPELARLLTTVDPAEVTDWTLVELVDAAVRQESWARAVAASLAAALAGRECMRPRGVTTRAPLRVEDVAGTELAFRLSWSQRAAARLVRTGRAFDGVLADTGAALARGTVDAPRAQAVVDRLADVPVPVALAAQDEVLPRAAGRTVSQVRADLERALIRTDPAEAVARRERARSGRRVDRPVVLPNGMAGLWAVLPAPDAVRVHGILDAAARAARAAGDPRTLDQLRADGLTDLFLHDTCPARAAGAPGAPDTAVRADDAAPADDPPGPDGAPGTGGPPAPGSAGCSDGPRPCGCPARPRPTALVRVTVALSTLLGLDERPADLAGYGALDAVAARALALGGVWQRVVTDDLSGTVLDLGRTRYRPTAALAEHVRVRDRTCVRPGCDVPAESCDLDHTEPFHPRRGSGDRGGTTSAGNLDPLCRRDHRYKTEGVLRLRQRRPGEFDWLTPTGHHYAVRPEPPDPPVPAEPPTRPDRDDPPGRTGLPATGDPPPF